MKIEEIREYNEVIAGFMGYTKHNHVSYITYEKDGNHIYDSTLQYDSSWDWLMRVIDKLENDDKYIFDIKIGFVDCDIQVYKKEDKYLEDVIKAFSTSGVSKIYATYNAVNHIIDWYNENK